MSLLVGIIKETNINVWSLYLISQIYRLVNTNLLEFLHVLKVECDVKKSQERVDELELKFESELVQIKSQNNSLH